MRSPMPISAMQHQGKSFPLGATLCCGGANFCVFAKHSSAVQLLLFDPVGDPELSRVIAAVSRSIGGGAVAEGERSCQQIAREGFLTL